MAKKTFETMRSQDNIFHNKVKTLIMYKIYLVYQFPTKFNNLA